VGGGLFCYFVVFPFAVEFLVGFDKTLVPSLRIGDYLGFTLRMVFVFGLVFEMPLISLLLTRMGMLTPRFLNKNRRYAIVIIFIVAAVLTPPDAFTQILLAGPLLVLYEARVLVSWLAQPRKKPE
jgi:sec-independent protein translocase protein TatC